MMRRGLIFRGGALVMLLALSLGGAFESIEAQQSDDLNNNGIPDVCRGAPYTYQFLGITPSTTPGRFLYQYKLTADSDAARKKINRIVFTFSRGVVPSNIFGASVGGENTGINLGAFGSGDTATKVAFGATNDFTGAITVKAGTALSIPFTIETNLNRAGLAAVGTDTGTGGFAPCLSRLTDAVAGPMGIEGPSVSQLAVDTNSVIATQSVLTSPANDCPLLITRGPNGGIQSVVYTQTAIDNGCAANPIEQVQLLNVTINGVAVDHMGDTVGGNSPIIFGSTDKCTRICDPLTGFCYYCSTTGTTRNGCKT